MEIKFKAWHKHHKKMCKVIALYQLNSGKITMVQLEGFNNLIPVAAVELMQFIGRRDKNEQEIFKGDIVKLADTNPVLFEVDCILARFGYKFVFKHLNDGTSADGYFLDRCEKIGNIWENPELLEGKVAT